MIVTPIRKLLAGTREVGLGNLEISIPHKHEDEMKTLIDGFNSMVESLKKHQLEMAEMSKKVAWAEMARKVAHEIKNPLTPIQLSAEHLLRVYNDKREEFEETLNESTSYIIKEVDNLRRIAKEFLEIAKRDPELRRIPVIVLTSSDDDQDILDSFDLGISGYMLKPVDYLQFVEVVKTIDLYWTLSKLPAQ